MVPGGRHGVAKGKEQLFTKLNVLLTGDRNEGEETLEMFGYITPDSYIMKKVANPQIESYKPKYPPHPVKTSISFLVGVLHLSFLHLFSCSTQLSFQSLLISAL